MTTAIQQSIARLSTHVLLVISVNVVTLQTTNVAAVQRSTTRPLAASYKQVWIYCIILMAGVCDGKRTVQIFQQRKYYNVLLKSVAFIMRPFEMFGDLFPPFI